MTYDHLADLGVGLIHHRAAPAPNAPTDNTLLQYAETIAGETRPRILNQYGQPYTLSPSFDSQRISYWVPGAAVTGISSWGGQVVTTGTLSQPAIDLGSFQRSQLRSQFQTAATVNSASEVRDGLQSYWHGNAPRRGGHYHYFLIGTSTIALDSTAQIAVGLSSSGLAFAGDAHTSLPNWIGLYKMSGNSSVLFGRRNGNGTAEVSSLGINWDMDLTLELILSFPSNSNTVFARVRQLGFDAPSILLENSYTTNIPGNTTFLGRRVSVRTGVAVAQQLQMQRVVSYAGW